MTLNEYQQNILREIVAEMPAAQPPLGHKPNWGPAHNRSRAYHLAGMLGFHKDTKCNSCDADVWDHLRQYIPRQEPFKLNTRP